MVKNALEPVTYRSIDEPCDEGQCHMKFGFDGLPLSVNPGKIQNAGPSPSVFRGKKIQSVALHDLYMFLCFEFFFPRSALGDGP